MVINFDQYVSLKKIVISLKGYDHLNVTIVGTDQMARE